ncbi:MAG TPA: 30S ribosomal protein S6 [Chthoniobacteraceae bacterium]|jgi:ribosomal protein S6|nr:30S ribosomal protein S6 [Chthoniobacteraceae bacterium]
MKNKYEALLVLNTKGNEDGANKIIDRLESEFKKEGAEIEQVQRLERRHFSYSAGPLDSGYFVNFIFAAEPALIDKIKGKFKLDADIYRAHYQKIPARKKSAAKAADKAADKAA